MGGDLHNLDLVLFALVAVFLVLRLRSVLGQRNDNDTPPPERWTRGTPDQPTAKPMANDNVIDLESVRTAKQPADLSPAEAAMWAIDPTFDVNGFLTGARAAFDIIVEAYARGDRQALRPLLADQVFQSFCTAIDQREQLGHTLVTEVMGFRRVELCDAQESGPLLTLTVRFVTDQVNMRKDRDGRILDGDPIRTNRIMDEWSFRRDRQSTDPNWQLVSTRAPSNVES